LDSWLSDAADVAQVLTAAVALGAATRVVFAKPRRRKRLERYLERQLEMDKPAGKAGERTILHLMRSLALAEAEILQAAFSSKWIQTRVASDPATGRADTLLFAYAPKGRRLRG
jgi:hypothetical protein